MARHVAWSEPVAILLDDFGYYDGDGDDAAVVEWRGAPVKRGRGRNALPDDRGREV
jgi:hypothetical protein